MNVLNMGTGALAVSILIGGCAAADAGVDDGQSDTAAVEAASTMSIPCVDGSKVSVPSDATASTIAAACSDGTGDMTDPESCPAEPLERERLSELFAGGVEKGILAKDVPIRVFDRKVNAFGASPWKWSENAVFVMGPYIPTGQSTDVRIPGEIFLSMDRTGDLIRIHFMQPSIDYRLTDGNISPYDGRSTSLGLGVANCNVATNGAVECSHGRVFDGYNHSGGADAKHWSGTVGRGCARLSIETSNERMLVIFGKQ